MLSLFVRSGITKVSYTVALYQFKLLFMTGLCEHQGAEMIFDGFYLIIWSAFDFEMSPENLWLQFVEFRGTVLSPFQLFFFIIIIAVIEV